MTGNVGVLIVGIIIGIIFFLAIREIVCWYFKINHRLSILEDIKNSLINIENANDEILKNNLETSENIVSNTKNMTHFSEINNKPKITKKYIKTDEDKFYENITSILTNTTMKLSSNIEIELLNKYIKMNYSEILELEKNINDLTQDGKKVIQILREEINKYII